jgi:hypothetical protein
MADRNISLGGFGGDGSNTDSAGDRKPQPRTSATKDGHVGLNSGASNVDPYWYKLHDIFNIISIPIVAIPNLVYILRAKYVGFENMPSVLAHLDSGYVDDDAFYHFLHWLFVAYLIIDTVWVIVRPRSVPAPVMIVLHHIVSLLGWSMPVLTGAPYLRKWTTLAMMVEANTFFLILRRNVSGRVNFVLDYFFLLTWVVFRVAAYAYITIFYPYYYFDQIFSWELNASKSCYIMVIFLDIMNAKWTADLLYKYDVTAMLTRRPSEGGHTSCNALERKHQ